ncbi:pyridoxal 5'-phosphate synthase glutaminase subunit PdxT [Nakamurella sp. A5-74]|uniref:Pyridoxal 5'-phosphate synthase subunit PdxT n=1 Tax=Nakamurella sp. A5-74 TaxID=3158264 RepID=A0AAU8DRE2_9ACTN
MNLQHSVGRRPRVGVLALQGGVAEHVRMLESAGAQAVLVRRPAHLTDLDGIVLPGGESSTIDRLLRLFGLADPLRALITGGLPTLATCAGMVLLAEAIQDPAPDQQSLGILPITVQRNAFGAQVVSEEALVETVDGPVRAAFIRAPIVIEVGRDVEVTARHRGRIVGVRRADVTAISFHPELTGDPTLHAQLVSRCRTRDDVAAPVVAVSDRR